MKEKIFIKLLILALLLNAGLVNAQVLNPTQDTYVRGGSNGDTNYGTETELQVKQGGNENFKRRTMLQFDLSTVEASEFTALLRLYATRNDGDVTLSVSEIPDTWDDATVTWNTAPAEGDLITSEAFATDQINEYFEFDVTEYVKAQLAGDNVASFSIFDQNADNVDSRFNSKEATDNLPELVISEPKLVSTILFYMSDTLTGAVPDNPGDSLIYEYLTRSGYVVNCLPDDNAAANIETDTAGIDLIIVSSTISSGNAAHLVDVDKPIISWEKDVMDEWGIVKAKTTYTDDEIEILDNEHPITQIFPLGDVKIFYTEQTVNVIRKGNEINYLTRYSSNWGNKPLWVVEKGDSLLVEDNANYAAQLPDSLVARGRRIGVPLDDDAVLEMNKNGIAILLNAVDFAIDSAINFEIPAVDVRSIMDTAAFQLGNRYSSTIYFEVLPANATNQGLTITVSDANIAMVTDNGSILGINTGFTTIYAESADGGYKDSLVVEVVDAGITSILFLVDDATNLNASDARILEMMQNTGYHVNVVTGANSVVEDTTAQSVVVISSTLSSGTIRDKFKWVEKPVLIWENGAYDDFGMTNTDRGTISNLDPAIITLLNDTHPLASGLTAGEISLGVPGNVTKGTPYIAESNSAVLLGTLLDGANTVGGWFVYEVGDSLDPGTSGINGFPLDGLATGMRIGLPFEDNSFANPTPAAATILLNSIDYAIDGAIETNIPVADVILVAPDTLTLVKGQTSVNDSVNVLPSNTNDNSVTYSSRDEAVASFVDGTITAVAAGETYVLTTSGGVSDSLYVIVNDSVYTTAITVTPATQELAPTQTVQLVVNVAPDNATDTTVTFTSGDETIAIVDANGLVTAIAEGTTTITVTTNDAGLEATCEITVVNDIVIVTGVTLDQSTASIDIDATVQLTATIAPADATDKSVTWSSSDEAIATVDATGLVTGIAAGTATITVTTNDGSHTATSEITVNPDVIKVTGVTLDQSSATIDVAATVQLTASVEPNDASDKSVTWSSSDETIATVDANGLVTGVAAGISTITVTTSDGGFTASAEITVELVNAVNILSATSFKIYPNPATKQLMIEGNGITSVSLFTPAGNLLKMVKQDIQKGIDVSALESGMYLLKITTNDSVVTKAFMKE